MFKKKLRWLPFLLPLHQFFFSFVFKLKINPARTVKNKTLEIDGARKIYHPAGRSELQSAKHFNSTSVHVSGSSGGDLFLQNRRCMSEPRIVFLFS